jgi:hypothetical protein
LKNVFTLFEAVHRSHALAEGLIGAQLLRDGILPVIGRIRILALTLDSEEDRP